MADEGGPSAALSDAVAQRALFSLQEAVEVVLQFIEQTCEVAAEEQEAAGAGAAAGAAALVRRALLLAALRALARCGRSERFMSAGALPPRSGLVGL